MTVGQFQWTRTRLGDLPPRMPYAILHHIALNFQLRKHVADLNITQNWRIVSASQNKNGTCKLRRSGEGMLAANLILRDADFLPCVSWPCSHRYSIWTNSEGCCSVSSCSAGNNARWEPSSGNFRRRMRQALQKSSYTLQSSPRCRSNMKTVQRSA